MPFSKRVIAARAASAISAEKRRRLRTEDNSTTPGPVPNSEPTSTNASNNGQPNQPEDLPPDPMERDSSLYEGGKLGGEEDQRPMPEFPIGQPAEGWCDAERKAPGHTRTRAYKQKAYYHRNKDELRRRREEKMAKEAGIPVSKKPKPIYGNIGLLFGASAKAPPSELRHDLPE